MRAVPLKPRSSAVKLYAWLAYRGVHVQEDVAGVMSRIGLFEGAVVNARKKLHSFGLIVADFKPGRGASYDHTILNVKTSQPLDWEERPSYFQVPHSLMCKDQYAEISGTALLVYLVILAMVNKTDKPKQTLTTEKLAERACVSIPTLGRAVTELACKSAPLLRMAAGEVELLVRPVGTGGGERVRGEEVAE